MYNILIQFRISMKLVRLIIMCLNEINSEVRVGKYFADTFYTKIRLNKVMLYRHCYSALL
jgi:hypothetical protein